MKLSVVGKEEFVLGFRMVGLHTVHEIPDTAVYTVDLERTLRKVLEQPDIGIIVLHEEDFGALNVRFQNRLTGSIRPVVITLSTEYDTALRDRVKKAMGVDLWA